MRHFSRNPPSTTLDARTWSRAAVLVLNVTYEALCEIPAERAVVLIRVGAAETVADREPRSRGGPNTWANLVACCAPCNQRKADRTPEEAGMKLVYLPYVPSRFESFLLEGRTIRADVHAWLAARLPKGSRLN